MLVRFHVPGPPTGKGRPRFDPRSRRAITPKKTRDYEAFCAMCGRMAMSSAGHLEPVEGPVFLRVLALFARPRRIVKGHVLFNRAGRVPLTGGGPWPDLSNVVKAIEDGLQGVIYRDDCQIWAVEGQRMYGARDEVPGVYVEVWV